MPSKAKLYIFFVVGFFGYKSCYYYDQDLERVFELIILGGGHLKCWETANLRIILKTMPRVMLPHQFCFDNFCYKIAKKKIPNSEFWNHGFRNCRSPPWKKLITPSLRTPFIMRRPMFKNGASGSQIHKTSIVSAIYKITF